MGDAGTEEGVGDDGRVLMAGRRDEDGSEGLGVSTGTIRRRRWSMKRAA